MKIDYITLCNKNKKNTPQSMLELFANFLQKLNIQQQDSSLGFDRVQSYC